MGKDIKNSISVAWNMFKSVVYIGPEISKTRDKERHPGILRISCPIVRGPKIVTRGKGKGDAPKLVTGR